MKKKSLNLSIEQKAAVDLCLSLSTRIACVTGGAGTGKTVVLGEVYRQLVDKKRTVILIAPTGRAAKRIHELTGIEAKTIHRLLEFPMPEEIDEETIPGEPRRNAYKRLDQQIVIVDESSMLAPKLYNQLMAALRTDGAIRFFGDNNQLPPVDEEGDNPPPFKTLLETRDSIFLTFNYRSEDAIVGAAISILEGRVPKRNDRFEIIYTADPIREVQRFVSKEFANEDHQIIIPTRRGNYGSTRLNPSLQLRFNPNGPFLRLDRRDSKEAPLLIRADDKFLWTKNDYGLELYNGEIGTVDSIDEEDGSLVLRTPDRVISVPPGMEIYNPYRGYKIQYDPRKNLELGYAITTHKSQGSEFKTIVYVICGGHYVMLNRNNFYTAVTRAKEQVIVIAEPRAMHLALRRYKPMPKL